MQILCLDIGSTTQDILLFDTTKLIENAIQIILPSPTILIARKIETATKQSDTIILTGETMGGGASTLAIRRHLESGLKVYATENAARSFRDNLEEVTSWGIQLISTNEVTQFKSGTIIQLADIELKRLEHALSNWNIALHPDVVAVAVLDHGVAPAGESDRLWRFKYLEQLLQAKGTLEAFMFSETEIPRYFTRMQSVVRTIKGNAPVVIMDTGAAAVMGSSFDRNVASHDNLLAVNLGNSHTIAFNLSGSRVLGLFEHHTSKLSQARLENLLLGTIAGDLKRQDIWEEGGHGSLIIEKGREPFITVTGPRRSLLKGSELNPYFAAPFGSMMLTGCFGLAKATAIKFPEWREEIEKALLR
ncbi:MAG: DUF1786 domain-containing protein [Dehalococcoidales bacterium]|nr:DUF1786 domain-containing protein [Dehalococcoidales bacterium]